MMNAYCIEFSTEEEARMKLYETYEHIFIYRISEAPQPGLRQEGEH